MRSVVLLVVVAACGSERLHTHAFVASTSCGQGPYDVHIPADGTTAEDGIEVIACTPRALAGHVQLTIASFMVADQTFGETAENQRCVASGAAITATASGSASTTAPAAGSGGDAVATSQLIEQPYHGSETPFGDQLCKELHLGSQTVLTTHVMERTTGVTMVEPGTDLHVRIWSDVPNDLSDVVFMIRHVTSKDKPPAPKREPAHQDAPSRPVEHHPAPDHGAPPPALAEERPPAPGATATWVPGYWTWTGSQWGWIAGFYRDEHDTLPAPRVEVPGARPRVDAIWVGGGWRHRGGAVIWVDGRWR